MTEEELKKEAKEYAEEYKMDSVDYHDSIPMEDAYIAGYNKANEWHYVKDGDLPKDEGMYLVCMFIFDNKDFNNPNGYVYSVVDVLIDEDKQKIFLEEDMYDSKWEQVVAWKEIVLPEPPKETKEK